MAESSIKCDHCGEDCGRYPVTWQGKNFCCEGCKTVYQLLNENKLTGYYDLYQSPGIKVDVQEFGKKYAYLDNEDILNQLIYFKEGEYAKVKFYIPEIHCSSCIWLLENLFQLNRSITQSSVNFVKKEVDITFKINEISLRKVVELLASIHYIPMISMDSVTQQKNKSDNRSLVIKIGVAGFVFGNTMLLSLPDYVPGGDLLESNFKHFFGYLNLLFSLPIVFYSGVDYLLSAYKNLKHKIINIDFPISIGILAIFLQSSYEIFTSTGTGYMDSLAGLVFFLLIGKWYQNKTYQALSFERDYKSYFPIAVTKKVNEKEEIIPLNTIQVGDRLVVHNQELIPADGILISGEANINYSFVTGESKPVTKRSGDELYAGGKQIGSAITIEVIKEVLQSRLTQLWNQDGKSGGTHEQLSKMIDKISNRFTAVILFIAFAAITFWLLVDPSLALIAFSSVLIVACPCALALSIPFTFGNIMRLFGQLGFYLRKSEVIEDLAKIDTIVFDKTGTITQIDANSVTYHGADLSTHQLIWIKSLARQSQHPLSKAINEYLDLDADLIDDISDFMEIASSGIKGSLSGVLLKMGNAEFCGSPMSDHISHLKAVVHVNIDQQYMGYYSIENKYREGIKELALELSKKFEIHLISGDNNAEEENLRSIFGKSAQIYFNQSPLDKFNYVKKLNEQGKYVMMVGDGLNDAGALKESYVGISIADDVFNFSPASDAILESSQIHYLSKFISKSKKSIRILYLSYGISFLYNVVGLSFAVSGTLSPVIAAVLMPISSVTVVAFVTIASQWLLRGIKD